jgi:hypothetical protein
MIQHLLISKKCKYRKRSLAAAPFKGFYNRGEKPNEMWSIFAPRLSSEKVEKFGGLDHFARAIGVRIEFGLFPFG